MKHILFILSLSTSLAFAGITVNDAGEASVDGSCNQSLADVRANYASRKAQIEAAVAAKVNGLATKADRLDEVKAREIITKAVDSGLTVDAATVKTVTDLEAANEAKKSKDQKTFEAEQKAKVDAANSK